MKEIFKNIIAITVFTLLVALAVIIIVTGF